MDYTDDFVIVNGILMKYTGPGGDLVIPEGVTHIFDGVDTFPEDVEFTSVFLPDSLEYDPWRGLRWSWFLKTEAYLVSAEHPRFACADGVLYDKNMTELLAYPSLKQGSLVLPKTLQAVDSAALFSAAGFTGFEVDPDNSRYCAPDGALYSKDLTKLILCPSGKRGTLTIPAQTTDITLGALDRCPHITGYDVSPENASFKSIDGVLYNKSGSRLLKYPQGRQGEFVVPDHVRSFHKSAFQDTAGLTKLTIPNSVVELHFETFKSANSLKTLVLPAKVYLRSMPMGASLEWIELTGEGECCSQDGVVLLRFRNGETMVLYCPRGRASAYTVPEDAAEIYEYAFEDCQKLPQIHFAGKLPKMVQNTFSTCHALRIPSRYLRTADKLPAAFALPAKHFDSADLQWAAVYQTAKIWKAAVEEQILSLNKADFFQGMLELLEKSDKLPKATGMNVLEFVHRWSKELPPEQIRALREILVSKKCPAAVKAMDDDQRLQAALNGKDSSQEKPCSHPVEQLVREHWVDSKTVRDLQQRIHAGIPYHNSDQTCHPDVLVFILASYAQQLDDTLKSCHEYKTSFVRAVMHPLADQAAQALDRTALQDLMEAHAHGKKPEEGYIPALDGSLLALGRYGSPAQISKLITAMRKWEKCGPIGKKSIIIARGGLMLSDTREAILAIDKAGQLSYYARIRGTTADALRDTVLCDFGLDEDGKAVWDLGSGRSVEIRLNRDLSLGIVDLTANKAVKSIPKKGADPQRYAQVSAAFSDMKKNAKKIAKARNDRLFQAFLDGSEFDAPSWKASYLKNPLLRQVAGLLVWEQGGKTFTVSDREIIAHDGGAVTLTDAPIRLAHPMEMAVSLVTGWQKYFTQKGLKQMFRQIWEPVFDPASIARDRYAGCTVPVLTLAGQKKHGIGVDNLGPYSDSFSLWLTNCSIQAEPSQPRYEPGFNDDLFYTLGDFTFGKYTRWTNHIVAWFDRYLIVSRIKADDPSVGNMLEGFTLAQITEFITLASEHGCTNVTAILLEYQRRHFSDLDPMEAFSLEW